MAQSPKIASLKERLVTEFRADWSSRKATLDLDARKADSAYSLKGLGRSGSLLQEHGRLYEQALEDARVLLIRRVAQFLGPVKRSGRARSLCGELRVVAGGELERLGATFEEELNRNAHNMGFGTTLGVSTQGKLQALLTTLGTELEVAVSEARRNLVPPPAHWYQRPVGLAVIFVIVGLVVWFLSTRVLGS